MDFDRRCDRACREVGADEAIEGRTVRADEALLAGGQAASHDEGYRDDCGGVGSVDVGDGRAHECGLYHGIMVCLLETAC